MSHLAFSPTGTTSCIFQPPMCFDLLCTLFLTFSYCWDLSSIRSVLMSLGAFDGNQGQINYWQPDYRETEGNGIHFGQQSLASRDAGARCPMKPKLWSWQDHDLFWILLWRIYKFSLGVSIRIVPWSSLSDCVPKRMLQTSVLSAQTLTNIFYSALIHFNNNFFELAVSY